METKKKREKSESTSDVQRDGDERQCLLAIACFSVLIAGREVPH